VNRYSLILASLFVLSSLSAKSQVYTYSESIGNIDFMYDIRNSLELKFNGPADNALSGWQTLPFNWSFYGQPVTGYYISDNGYITFDKTASVSKSLNTILPHAQAPQNSIFVFWDELHLDSPRSAWDNNVQTATIGTAPNRRHIIYWIGVTPERYPGSSSNTLSFTLVLNEGGDFDVMFVAGAHRPVMTGTIGCINIDGSLGTMVAGSPELDFPSVTSDPNDDITLSFSYNNNDLDAAADKSLIPATVSITYNYNVSFDVRNLGMNTIIGFDAHYTGTSEVLYTKQVRGVSVPPGGKHTVTFDNTWTPTDPGKFTDLTFWIDNVDDGLDGTFDTNQSNDTTVASIWVKLGVSASRNVLMEEFTGAWCGWCVDGAIKMQEIEQLYTDVSLVAIHASGLDHMITSEGQAIADELANGYPSGLVDRVKFQGESFTALSRSKWKSAVDSRRRKSGSDLNLLLNSSFNESSRVLDITAYMDFVDYPYPADFRLNVWIVEDRVVGQGAGWDQKNFYYNNSSYPNHPYFSLPNPVPDYVHRYVLRTSLTGAWGISLNQQPEAGNVLRHDYSYTVPPGYKKDDLGVIVFLTRYDPSEGIHEVLNSVSGSLNEVMPVKPIATEDFILGEITPQPLTGSGRITLTLSSTQIVDVSVYSVLGMKLETLQSGRYAQGVYNVRVNSHKYMPGLYYLVASVNGQKQIRKFSIIK
jgi:thiol-disulfide isomerase/thioredoxin